MPCVPRALEPHVEKLTFVDPVFQLHAFARTASFFIGRIGIRVPISCKYPRLFNPTSYLFEVLPQFGSLILFGFHVDGWEEEDDRDDQDYHYLSEMDEKERYIEIERARKRRT